jgi:hypothetical protein
MYRRLFLFALISVLTACSSKRELPKQALSEMAEVRVDHKRAAGIAYEHAVELEVSADHMRQVSDAVQQTCAALPDHGCTLLEASIRGGAAAGATVRMRITPDGVNTVLRSLDGRGKVLSQSSKGEDLAEPIQEGDRKMAMLTGYRDQLQTLARQRALEPEALIKLHRELADVQSEIDEATASQAQLRRRVDTELLTVAMHERAMAGQSGKVKQAVEDFGDDLLHGVAMLITFVASTIPFAVAGFIGYVAWRRLRAGRRHAKQPMMPGPDKR